MISKLQLYSGLKEGLISSSKCLTELFYLEQAALDHRDDQQHLFIRHVSSAHLESRGWDVKSVIMYIFFSLQKQQYVRSGKQIYCEYYVHVDKRWSHFLWHVYPRTEEVQPTLSCCTGGNFPLITPINTHLTHLFSYNTPACKPTLLNLRPNMSRLDTKLSRWRCCRNGTFHLLRLSWCPKTRTDLFMSLWACKSTFHTYTNAKQSALHINP